MDKSKPPGFFSIFPLLARIVFRAGKKLLSFETLVALEKKQGRGSGVRTPEEVEFETHLESTPVYVEDASSPYFRKAESLIEETNKLGQGRFVINEEVLRAVRQR
ncbi:hypothetical protein LCG56_27795 (plasmid) [Pseudomonas cannabina pv. alisalensis]|uniref:Uncharacterized protein n=1 Tax=Pseudomonas syringae pv. maculicola str. ES4326 TaxID=629265 RepID=A0A8T8CAK3_PSEYM|nr:MULTISPECIES: hypothetical protein [Pseudomonas syringae group]QHF00579.1 hypothetical protein PMA4326_029170 [Pseudomonas syringae pv. maculicola str. ES4326]UBZ00565.1 hypothetical protein LCG56_27795 [Pseudomonas cannabina pv. alisalensis]